MNASAQHDAAAQTAEIRQQQYLTFQLRGEVYAIDILHIKEIIGYGQVTQIPMVPEFIRGVINLRGRVVPVLDLSARFGRQVTAAGRRTCIVIVEVASAGEHQDIGVMVDAVNEVLEIPITEIEPPPSFGAAIRTDFIEGMGKINGRFIVILNVTHVLSVDELAMLGSAVAAEPDAPAGGRGAGP